MSGFIKTAMAACAFLALGSCTSTEKKEEVSGDGLFAISLSRFGKPFTLRVPDTTMAQLHIGERSDGSLNVRSGPAFGVRIYEEEADLGLKRVDLHGDEVNRFKSFIVDEPDAIVWESAITEPQFHFIVNKKIGDREYSFQDDPDFTFGANAIKTMYASAKEAKEEQR
jgi:hypothetical protein